MDELTLVKSENFGELQCDIYQGDDDFYMTREQIGSALGYADPRIAISKLHDRHKERLDRFSTVTKLVTVDGKEREVNLYNRKGIMEICRWSGQPKADEFMDWVWDVMDALFAGRFKLMPMTEYQRLIAESRLLNAQVRKAREYGHLADLYRGTDYAKILDSYASAALAGEHVLPLPALERKTYSATEIGEHLGITAHKVGLLTNRHNLKTAEFGIWALDKSPNSNKQVQSFRYYDSVIDALQKLL